jgi:hypothetical protein
VDEGTCPVGNMSAVELFEHIQGSRVHGIGFFFWNLVCYHFEQVLILCIPDYALSFTVNKCITCPTVKL